MNQPLVRLSAVIAAVCAITSVIGCRPASPPAGNLAWHEGSPVVSTTEPASTQIATGEAIKAVEAFVDPPLGWIEDPRRVDEKHAHLVWKSPSGDTAYGVVLMRLPLPVGPELVMTGFLNHLRQSDHEANLLRKDQAPDLHGYRFVAESGQYVIRVALSVRGWRAWAVYAGSLRSRPVNSSELDLAEQARDHTRVGLPAESAFTE